jgi:hypothetical protein
MDKGDILHGYNLGFSPFTLHGNSGSGEQRLAIQA